MAISVCITEDCIYAIEAKVRKKSLDISSFAAIPVLTPLYDDNGNLHTDLFASLLREATNSMRGPIILTNAVTNVISNEYVLPYENNERKMRNMILGETARKVGLDTYVMDFTITRKFKENGMKKCMLHAYLSPKGDVMNLLSCIKQAKRKPARMDVPQNAIFKLIDFLGYKDPVIFSNISNKQVVTHLFNPPVNILTRSVAGLDADDTQTAWSAAEDQISKMLQYQAIKQPDSPVSTVVLFGEAADAQMVAALTDRLEPTIFLFDYPNNVTAPAGFSYAKNAYALGALFAL